MQTPKISDINVAVKQGDSRCAHCSNRATWIIGTINNLEQTGIAKKVCLQHFIATVKSIEKILNEKELPSM